MSEPPVRLAVYLVLFDVTEYHLQGLPIITLVGPWHRTWEQGRYRASKYHRKINKYKFMF